MIADVLARTAPVLVFLVAVTIVAELSEQAGLPWRTVLVVLVLFVVQWLSDHGLAALLARPVGSGEGFVAHLRMAGGAAPGAEGVDNLPTYPRSSPSPTTRRLGWWRC